MSDRLGEAGNEGSTIERLSLPPALIWSTEEQASIYSPWSIASHLPHRILSIQNVGVSPQDLVLLQLGLASQVLSALHNR